MKKLFFYCVLLIIVCVACGDDTDALKNSIINANKQCPVQCENWTIDSLGLSKKGEIVYFCNSSNNADYMNLIKSKKDSVKNALIDELNNNEKTKKTIQLCKKHNAGLIYKFYSNSTNETIVIKIPVEKLIVDPSEE